MNTTDRESEISRSPSRSSQPGMHRSEVAVTSEYFITPTQYQEIFGRPYARTFTMPTIIVHDGRPTIDITTLEISADDWRSIHGSDMAIPIIIPHVRYSPTNGYREGNFYHFEVLIAPGKIFHPHDLGNPYRSFSVEDPLITEGDDGFRYFDYRNSHVVRVRDNEARRGLREVKIEEPSGIVLRWKREDEEHYDEPRTEVHFGLG